MSRTQSNRTARKAGPVLSLPAWRTKHTVKLSGLSNSEIKLRYQQYVTSQNQKQYNRSVPKGQEITLLPKLSKCAVDYLKALSNPFDDITPLPCIPDVLTLPSYKHAVRCRGKFYTGTAKYGYVLVRPWVMSNVSSQVTTTTELFTGDTIDFSQDPSHYKLYDAISDVSIADAFPSPPTAIPGFRLVGCGLRVSYGDQLLQRGGYYLPYTAPGNADILSIAPIPYTTIVNTLSTEKIPIEDGWVYLNYRPTNQEQLSYQPPATTSFFGNYAFGIMIDGTAVGQRYDFEVVGYWESLPTNFGHKTHSHSDPVGMGAVLASVDAHGSSVDPQRDVLRAANSAAKEVSSSTSQVIPLLKDAGAAITGLMGGFLGGPAGAAVGRSLGQLMMSGPPMNSIMAPVAHTRGSSVRIEEIE